MTAPERLAILSDIHGNAVALDAVLADAARRGVTRVVCLGDTVDLGPQPDACVARLVEDGIPFLVGNHDPLDEATGGALLAVQEWTKGELSAQTRAALDDAPHTLTIDLLGHRVFCAHGSPRSMTENVVAGTPDEELDLMLAPAVGAAVIAVGHTHVQLLRRRGACTVVNVGSVGMPFGEPYNGDPPSIFRWAEYAIVHAHADHTNVELCRVSYSFDAFAASFPSSFPGIDAWLDHWVLAVDSARVAP